MEQPRDPADLQWVWHEFVGGIYSNSTILDVGSGLGKSKERLLKNGNTVTTQEINRNLMNNVDMIIELRKIKEVYDVVTAFDVIEHTPDPIEFLSDICLLSRFSIFFTTPNKLVFPTNWHYTFEELMGFIYTLKARIKQVTLYARFKIEGDRIYDWKGAYKIEAPYFGFRVDWR